MPSTSLSYFVDTTVYSVLIFISLIVIGGGLYLVWKYAEPPKKPAVIEEDNEEVEEDEAEENRNVQNRGARGLRRMQLRRRGRVGETNQPAINPPQNDQNGDQEDTPQEREEEEKDSKPLPMAIGKKKAKKLAEKEERARIREAEEAARKHRREEDEKEMIERMRLRKEEEEKIKKEEEELEKLREERRRKEEEEYQQMKHSFSVEGTGSIKEEYDAFESNLEEFINHLKFSKVVMLEDLAAKYNLEPKVIVDKITELEKLGKITGIMDERGKFIYVSPQELQNIAKFVVQRGRVSIEEIARESNRLVDLNPKVTITEENTNTEDEFDKIESK